MADGLFEWNAQHAKTPEERAMWQQLADDAKAADEQVERAIAESLARGIDVMMMIGAVDK